MRARPWAAAGSGTATGSGVARREAVSMAHCGAAALSAAMGGGRSGRSGSLKCGGRQRQAVQRGCRWWRAAVGKGAGLTARGTAFMDSHDSRRSCLASLLSLYGRRGGLQRPSPTLCTCVLLLLLVLLVVTPRTV